MKTCGKCKITQTLECFVVENQKKDKLSSWCKSCKRSYHLKRTYGICQDAHDKMFEEQGGLCAICKQNIATYVDHKHSDNTVRALLCHGCNTFIGYAKEDIFRLEQAILYLKKHNTCQRS